MIFFKNDEITLLNGKEFRVLMVDNEFALIVPDIYCEEAFHANFDLCKSMLITNYINSDQPHPMFNDIDTIYDAYGNKVFDHNTQPFIERPPETLPKKRGRKM
ncbi:hypothetical protein [Paenibacillus elgii]|uniref:hypothetical protein n=1 Tax=Paenibacillus elgii TaxID=189691 RepID=UPI00203A3CF2|nr:hypothetical protein [Paenibacillus elgii]MCM3272652.1 hypothetical protein [Paenibacillus elgii]